jgi:hypothetical protein
MHDFSANFLEVRPLRKAGGCLVEAVEAHLHFEMVLGVLGPDQQAFHQAREIRQEVLRGETGNHHLRK